MLFLHNKHTQARGKEKSVDVISLPFSSRPYRVAPAVLSAKIFSSSSTRPHPRPLTTIMKIGQTHFFENSDLLGICAVIFFSLLSDLKLLNSNFYFSGFESARSASSGGRWSSTGPLIPIEIT